MLEKTTNTVRAAQRTHRIAVTGFINVEAPSEEEALIAARSRVVPGSELAHVKAGEARLYAGSAKGCEHKRVRVSWVWKPEVKTVCWRCGDQE